MVIASTKELKRLCSVVAIGCTVDTTARIITARMAEGLGQPLVKAHRVRALAVTSAQRAEQMPDVPALAETVPGYEAGSWQGWFAPATVPPEIVTRLNAEANKALRLPDVRERLAGLGMNVIGGRPEAFAAFFKADIAKWADVIKRSNVKL